ncbi:MAG: endonuclease/exonuclease/phosphatase family protein [Opitutales bacterium]|nr:endonuclease/exonuclease/phosphatase family protein [Opitutales bacterium]
MVEGSKLFLFLFFGSLLSVCLAKADILRVASINVENYLLMDRWVDGKWRRDYPKPSKEKRALRSMINQVNPDILVIQEIGDEPFLNELWMDLNVTQGTQFLYSAWMHGSYKKEQRHLAILSKVPFHSVLEHVDISFTYFGEKKKPSRGLMEINFKTNGQSWSIFNLHLKSKWTERKDDPEANLRREKEARAMRDFIRGKYPPSTHPRYIVAGDFNDHKNSQALRRFMKVSETTLSSMLPCQDQNRHFWTHYYAKEDSYARLDYLLVSPSMQKHYTTDTARIYDGYHTLMASDHRMVYADFKF